MTTWYIKCPACHEAEVIHRSHLRLRDIPFLLIGMRPYRCLLCYRRFHTWKRAGRRVHVGKMAQNGGA